MISDSPEIAAIVRRWNRAVRQRDAATLRNLLSTSHALSYVGSAEGEYFMADVLHSGFIDHVHEIPDFSEQEESLDAFENGETGWAVWHGWFTFAGKDAGSLNRITFVLVLEAGSWKIVQMHLSNPTPNIAKLGKEMSALDNLVRAARDGFRLDQREGMATVMFTDVANSSGLAALLGDRAWASRIRDHFTEVQGLIETEGGQFVKSLGDGTMSCFDSARAALTAARIIQRHCAASSVEPVLGVRIGIHTGPVIQAGDDFFGTVVNKAARIADLAAPGEVRISDATRLMAGEAEGLAFDRQDKVELRGLEGTHLIHRVSEIG